MLVVLPAVAPACASGPPPAGDLSYGSRGIRVREVPYDVRGSTHAEIGRELAGRGPALEGRRRFGVTKWDLDWSVHVRREGMAGCAVEEARVESEIVVRLPRWRPPPDADPELVADWRRFVRALRAHERGHRDRILVGAEALRRKLEGLHGPTCPALHQQAREVAREQVEAVDRANRAYDRATRGGATQGAEWPPGSGDARPSSR